MEDELSLEKIKETVNNLKEQLEVLITAVETMQKHMDSFEYLFNTYKRETINSSHT